VTKSTETPRKRIPNPLSKEQRARDAAEAMRDYEADAKAVLARTARLRELRLAREAATPKPDAAPKPRKRKKTAG
jgi:hypothetical protein